MLVPVNLEAEAGFAGRTAILGQFEAADASSVIDAEAKLQRLARIEQGLHRWDFRPRNARFDDAHAVLVADRQF